MSSDDSFAGDGHLDSDIAIVGMAAHLPGARTIDEYWKNLVDGVESVRFYTDEELLAEGVPKAHLRHPRYVKAAAELQDMELFDGELFGFSPKESAILDPQHRHFTECCWEALEDAAHMPESFEGPIGIFGGCGMGSYFYFNLCSNPDLVDSVGMFLLRHTGNDKDFLVTRVSHVLNLTGPAVNVQTACSTSLVAVHYAVQSLLSQECDMALAGGVTIELPHRHGYFYKEGEVLSPDGHCHAFDHRGQGTVFGSGAGVVVLRRLEDAIADRDHIYAVIRGTAINNDGASKAGYLAPSVQGQASCIVEAHGIADVSADSIGYVECHGTGTYLGDPIEVSALTEAFRQSTDATQFCRIGSVKSNIGHLDTAAGVASLIKAALILEREQIPASLNFERPNPTIDFDNSPFVVNSELRAWPRGPQPRRAGVQSLGVGGTNAHVILQEPPPPPESAAAEGLQLLVLSGRNRKAVEGNAKKLGEWLQNDTDANLADVAYTLWTGRRHMERRQVVAARDVESAARILRGDDPRRTLVHTPLTDPKIALLFPGGGAQYAGMARGLYDANEAFRAVMDQAFSSLGKYDLRAAMWGDDNERLFDIDVQLPAIFSVSVGLAKALEAAGIEADAMLGHSLGEYAAACMAGVFDFREALGLVLKRAELMAEMDEGAMLALAIDADELRANLPSELDLACDNAPGLSVVSGPPAAIESYAERLESRGEEPQRIRIDRAAHSRMFDPILPKFRAHLETMTLRKPTRRFVSSRTGTWITDAQATDPAYWTDHLRHTIQFRRGLELLSAQGPTIYIEAGPGRSVGSFAKAIADIDAQAVIPALRHRDEQVDDDAFFLETRGRVWALGGPTLEGMWNAQQQKRVRLPTYAFQRQHYFIEPGTQTLGTESVTRFEDVRDFAYVPRWSPKAPTTDVHEPTRWLVFLDDAGVGSRLVRQLRKEGHAVTTVVPGDTFAKRSESDFVLSPERGREGYDLLFRELMASGRIPQRIVHLWLLTADESFRPGSSFFHRNQERGFYSLFFLTQAIAEENLPRPIDLCVITNGMMAGDEESVRYPAKATVLGPVRVAPRELPGLSAHVLDVQLPAASNRLFGGRLAMALVDPFAGRKAVGSGLDAIASAVLDEVKSSNDDVAILREGKRSVRTWTQTPIDAAEIPWPEDSTIVITGGLGGLGLVAARQLAPRRLVLIGRGGLPPRDEWDETIERVGPTDVLSRKIAAVRDLEAAGSKVLVERADVTNVEEIRGLATRLRERFGRVHAVVHTAGTVADDLIQLKSLPEIEEVFAPKIHGTQVLAEQFPDAQLVLYSSTSTVVAPAGQVDYVAANAYLDAFAESTPRARTVQWGIWNQVGMAAEAFDATDLSARPEELPPTKRPLFDHRVRDAYGQLHLVGLHSPSTHWIYDEHRVKAAKASDPRGHALIPGTGYLELAAQALDELGEGRRFSVRDLFFIRPLQLGDSETREVRVKLRRSDVGYAMEIRSACSVEGRPAWQLHAQCTLALTSDRSAPPKLDLDPVRARTANKVERGDGIRSPQEKHLSFGNRWRVLQEARYGESEALGTLKLSREAAGDTDWILHPALLDIATGFAMDIVPGYTNDDVWVPVSYDAIHVFDALPDELLSWVRVRQGATDFALFDVDLARPNGEVVAQVRGFSMRRIEGSVFGLAKPPTRADVEMADQRGEERTLSPTEERLRRNLERGIVPSEGGEAFVRFLGSSARRMLISSLDLDALVSEADKGIETATSGAKFARPDLDSDYVEPRDDVERALVGFWEELLGVENVGVQDSFFDLGGHSLIAVRLFAMVKKAFAVEFPISVLFEAPTIEACAALIRDQMDGPVESTKATKTDVASRRYTHLVAMHPGDAGTRTPFFLVAGMFGNVLNLRHLAHLIGTDRPFYGLQAKGLYGGEAPHETFEEMAEAYLAELRTVQPRGPYMLGGFSGGGYTALEMARQLRKSGEDVSLLVMLDTPAALVPERLTLRDRILIQQQRLEKKGAGYVVEWAQSRLEWELGRLRRRFEEPEQLEATEFHNDAIEAAFRRALDRYSIPSWEQRLVLFRPPLEKAFVLGPDKILNHDREYVWNDNGWSHYCEHVEVHEVPGDHDSMVLEPNVRVLARKLRAIIEAAEAPVVASSEVRA